MTASRTVCCGAFHRGHERFVIGLRDGNPDDAAEGFSVAATWPCGTSPVGANIRVDGGQDQAIS